MFRIGITIREDLWSKSICAPNSQWLLANGLMGASGFVYPEIKKCGTEGTIERSHMQNQKSQSFGSTFPLGFRVLVHPFGDTSGVFYKMILCLFSRIQVATHRVTQRRHTLF